MPSLVQVSSQTMTSGWPEKERLSCAGVSTWFMHNKLHGDEETFKKKYMLGESAGEYAIHGGGVPVRVHGVEGIVGVIVVSGLKQHEDHQVVVEGLEEYIEGLNKRGEQ